MGQWVSHEAVVPDADSTVGGVVFTIALDTHPSFINVRAEIPVGAASPAGGIIARLHATSY